MCALVPALLAVTAALQATSMVQQGNFQKSQMESQAQMMEWNAKREETAQALRDDDRQRRTQALVSAQRALYGANGADPNSGSAFDVQLDTWKDSGRDGFNESFKSQGLTDSLAMNAANSRMTGDFAQSAGFMNAAGTLLNYGANYAMYTGTGKPSTTTATPKAGS